MLNIPVEYEFSEAKAQSLDAILINKLIVGAVAPTFSK